MSKRLMLFLIAAGALLCLAVAWFGIGSALARYSPPQLYVNGVQARLLSYQWRSFGHLVLANGPSATQIEYEMENTVIVSLGDSLELSNKPSWPSEREPAEITLYETSNREEVYAAWPLDGRSVIEGSGHFIAEITVHYRGWFASGRATYGIAVIIES